MSTHTPGAWQYFRNSEGTYTVTCPFLEDKYIAEVITGEADARLVASAPEMKIALKGALGALIGTKNFMSAQGLNTEYLNEITGIIGELLSRIEDDDDDEQVQQEI